MAVSNTYSFKDVTATISGPNGRVSIGSSAGAAEEGITVSQIDDKASMTIGSGGEGMHSLHMSNAGKITVRLLKTSRTNALLDAMASADFSSAAVYGQNQITISDMARGDVIQASGCGFVRKPDNSYSKQGNIIEWSWNCVDVDQRLGSGTPAVS